jgi:hypothetical protein
MGEPVQGSGSHERIRKMMPSKELDQSGRMNEVAVLLMEGAIYHLDSAYVIKLRLEPHHYICGGYQQFLPK